jgi:hypothetical protein
LGIEFGRHFPIGKHLLVAGFEIDGKRATLGAEPEPLFAAHRVKLTGYFSLFNKTIIDPAKTGALVPLGRTGHHTTLPAWRH